MHTSDYDGLRAATCLPHGHFKWHLQAAGVQLELAHRLMLCAVVECALGFLRMGLGAGMYVSASGGSIRLNHVVEC